MNKLFSDLKTDEEKSNFFLSGRGYETGVIAPAIQNDVAMAYHRCAEYEKEVQALRKDAERLDWLDAKNAPFSMGWKFGASPAGNVQPYAVVQLGGNVTTIRDAIDAAMENQK